MENSMSLTTNDMKRYLFLLVLLGRLICSANISAILFISLYFVAKQDVRRKNACVYKSFHATILMYFTIMLFFFEETVQTKGERTNNDNLLLKIMCMLCFLVLFL